MTCPTQKQHVCTKNKRLISDKKEGTPVRPLLGILMLHDMHRYFRHFLLRFPNDKNGIVHSLPQERITVQVESNPYFFLTDIQVMDVNSSCVLWVLLFVIVGYVFGL